MESKYSIADILEGFSSRTQIETFCKNNSIVSNLTNDAINQLIWKKTLEEKLTQLNINPTMFFDLLKKYDMVLSGSLVLQAMENTEYKRYDIDIIAKSFSEEMLKEFDEKFNMNGYKLEKPFHKDVQKYYNNTVVDSIYNISFYNPHGHSFLDKETNCYKLQIIVPMRSIKEYINSLKG